MGGKKSTLECAGIKLKEKQDFNGGYEESSELGIGEVRSGGEPRKKKRKPQGNLFPSNQKTIFVTGNVMRTRMGKRPEQQVGSEEMRMVCAVQKARGNLNW